MARLFGVMLIAATLAGCAQRAPVPFAVMPPPAVMPRTAVPLPAGASPGMTIPLPLADGRYPTPSYGLSGPATLWHLRGALNVAALACRGPVGDTITLRYNALLAERRTLLARAQTAVADEYRKSAATKWQDAWDNNMTRLYNFYALAPARDGFCSAASRVLDAIAATPPERLADYAPAGLAEIDRPFTDFFRAYDAWRTQTVSTASVAMLSAVPVAPRIPPQRPVTPTLTVDPAIFR